MANNPNFDDIFGEWYGNEEEQGSLVQEVNASINNEQPEDMYTGTPDFDRIFAEAEAGPVEPREVETLEEDTDWGDSMWDSLKAGYYGLRKGMAGSGAREVAELDVEKDPESRYAPGTLGAKLEEEAPELRRQLVQKKLDESSAFAAKEGALPPSKELTDFLDEESDKSIWEALKAAPVQIITELGARSLPMMAPGLAGGAVAGAVAGAPGFAAGMGVGSARVDFAATMIEEMKQRGVDVTDADSLIEFVKTDEYEQLVKDATKRAAAIGGMDALAGLVGAKMLTPGIKNKVLRELANVGVQMPIQMGAGAGGEAIGQLAMGQDLQPREIAAEAVGELVTAPVDVAAAAYSGSRADTDETDGGDGSPLSDLEKAEKDTAQLGQDIGQLQALGAEEIAQVQEQARAEAAAKGGDALDQEMAAAEAGKAAGGKFDEQIARLQNVFEQRMAADEEARYAEDQVKEDEARATIQEEAAKRYEEGVQQIEAENRAAVSKQETAEKVQAKSEQLKKQVSAAESTTEVRKAEAVTKTRKAEKADAQLRKLRRRRQELGLEPKTDLEGTSPYPSPEEVKAFKGNKPQNMAMAEALAKATEQAKEEGYTQPVTLEATEKSVQDGRSPLSQLGIVLENPKGSVRKGPGWETKLKDHYGFIPGTESAEGKSEELDVFVGKDTKSEVAFVVDQVDENGQFDEHKVMLGYPNMLAARRAYARNYPKGFKVGEVSQLSLDEFKKWAKSGDKTVPFKRVKPKGKKGDVKPSRILLRQGEEASSKRLVKAIKERGGFTVNNKGQAVTKGFAVGQGMEVVIDGEVTEADLDAFKAKYADALGRDDNTLGAWYDKESGKTFLDVSQVFDTVEEAMAQAAANEELAIYDLEKGEEIRLDKEEVTAAPAPEQAPSSFVTKKMSIADLENVKGDKQRKSPAEMVEFTKKIQSGEIKPNIIVKTKDGVPSRIVEGNHTLRVLKALGHTTVEVKVQEAVIDEGRNFHDFFANITKGLAGKSSTGKEYSPVIKLKGSPAMRKFLDAYTKYRGNFDDHIAFSIPGFKEVQVAVGTAISKVYGKQANILDIGASEGSFVKAITSVSGARTIALDPNEAMQDTFNATPVEGSEYSLTALGTREQEGEFAWEEDGTNINYFDPQGQKFDVIHEAMVFQFISPDRQGQISRVKELLSADGVAVFEEKMFTNAQEANEAKKNEYKRQYFHAEEMTKKAAEVLEGMDENTVHQESLEKTLTSNFKHVYQFWDSGNFKGYVASDSRRAGSQLVEAIGDTQTEFSTTETPRKVKSPDAVRRDVQLRKVDEVTRKVDKAEADVVVKDLNDKLPGLKLNLLENPYLLPDAVFDRITSQFGAAGMEARGLIDTNTGEIYVFSDNHSSLDDLVVTAMHEGVGHKGLRTLFSDDQRALLLDSVFANGDRQALNRIGKSYGLDPKVTEDQRLIADEYIAEMAEKDIDAPIMQRVIDAVRQVLRDLGILNRWTDADIKALLRRTRSALKDGKPLSKIKLRSEVEVAETGEVVAIQQTASVALRQMDKRIEVLKKLRGCVG